MMNTMRWWSLLVALAFAASVPGCSRQQPPRTATPAPEAASPTRASPSPTAGTDAATGDQTLSVRQSPDDRHLLIVTGPWGDRSDAVLLIAYALAESTVQASTLEVPWSTGHAEAVAFAKAAAEQNGVDRLSAGMDTLVEQGIIDKSTAPEDLGVVVGLRSHLGKWAAYFVQHRRLPGQATASGALAKFAAYADLQDWANDETGALEIELSSDHFHLAGELCATVALPDGEKLAQATTQVDFIP